ncbi:hypothetical protein LSH36_48g05020 [Paralvinella palmiformis]|uniref:NACHT domain-containing protein n=1 Tax=Paralvinella palmiformis TaxID=53620 RepID=A0AAD9K629_9ANNE|nr:hypothetical protein LSH36_48g05020 [Paralvinella palmiformis]
MKDIGGAELSKAADSSTPNSSCLEPKSGYDDTQTGQQVVLRRALEGWCTLKTLPPQNSNVVRIFVSSTFSDTKEERNAFMEKVYPRLEEMCREEYGLEFQVMDMRWGVPEQASDNHSTTELCLQEIIKCQEVSVGPSFVVLLGNKYGYRPIPNEISRPEFECLQAVARVNNDIRWTTVTDWYNLDENNTPSHYVLQPISLMIPHYNDSDNAQLRKQAQNTWNDTDKTLTNCLRDNARRAYQSGTITGEQKHRYFMSVTENEIDHGMMKNKRGQKETCLCIIREIPDIADHLREKKSPKFIDIHQESHDIDGEAVELMDQLKQQKVKSVISENNLTKVDIEWKASGATISLEQVKKEQDVNLSTFAEKLLHKKTNVSKHKEYIDQLCSDYLEKLTSLIASGGKRQEKFYDEMGTEVLQHWHFSRSRCEIFEGRQDVIGTIKCYISSKTTFPLIIYGKSGCGKTSIIAKLVDIISRTISEKGQPSHLPFRLCFRFLGTTPLTSNIQQVLISVCQQISIVCDVQWEKPNEYPDVVKSFHKLLSEAAQSHRLILILDSVDQLLPAYNAYSMNWLPDSLPRNVKLVVSSLNEGYSIIDTLQHKYSNEKGNECQYVEIKPLEKDTGFLIIQKWLEKAERTISRQQGDVIKEVLGVCGLPLFARIMFDQVRKWRSYEHYTLQQLETTVKGAINKLYEQMETKFGLTLVKHSLSYLTSSRYGISEVELEHVMSLDDQLLNTTFTYWRPPIRRIPPLLWIRVRGDINSYIVERSVDGIMVLQWYHRQFIAATKERYLRELAFRCYIHSIMDEYFSGMWGGGKAKSFNYTKSQAFRFGFNSTEAREDRKVPVQPYVIERHVNNEKEIRFNQRKVSELPFHLAEAGNFDQLKKAVFFNIEWLLAKLHIGSATDILQELEIFISTYETIRSDKSYNILYATLQFMKTCMTIYPLSLPYELSGRLAKYIKRFSSIRHLVRACDTVGSMYCPLIPATSCFESAQADLKQSFSTAKSEPWHDGGALCFTDDFKTMYAILYNEAGMRAHLSIWDVAGGNEFQRLPIAKSKGGTETIDVYFHMQLHHGGKHVVAQYRHFREKLFQSDKDKYTNVGHLDVIDVSSGNVIRTFESLLHGRSYNNSVYYMKGDWITVRFGSKLSMLHLFEDRIQRYSRPHMLTNDCNFLIKICTKRFEGRFREGGKRKVKYTKIDRFWSRKNEGKNVGVFDDAETIMGMAVTSNDKFAILGEIKGEIKLYQLQHLTAEKMIKLRRHLTLPYNERVKILDGMQEKEESDDSDSAEEEVPVEDSTFAQKAAQRQTRNKKMSIRLALIICPNDRFVISVHQNNTAWEAFLWNFTVLKGFIGRIADQLPLDVKYPQFSHNSQLVVLAIHNTIRILSTVDAAVVRIYTFSANVRDLCVSRHSDDVVAMLGMEIVQLELTEAGADGDFNVENGAGDHQPHNTTDSDQTLCLPKEELTSKSFAPEIQMGCDERGDVKMAEVNRKAELSSSGLLEPVEVHGMRRVALDVHFAPDMIRVVRLFKRIQVLDVANESIRYTPFRGDVFFKSPNTDMNARVAHRASGYNINKDLSELLPLSLGKGDKIVGSNGRIRFRISGLDNGTPLKMVDVPSYIAVHEAEPDSPRLIFGISVYEERIGAVSNNYLVTNKTRQNGQYISVYGLERGTLLTTHAINGGIAATTVLPDEKRLAVIDLDLAMHVFAGENFVAELGRHLLCSAGDKSQYNINEVVTFPKHSDVVLVRYSQNKGSGAWTQTYVHVNVTTTKRVAAALPLSGTLLDDISCDGTLGIDSQLMLYDLVAGRLFTSVPYAKRSPHMQIHARISEDKRRVAFIDQRDDTIHVFGMTGRTLQPLASCHAHVPKMPTYGGFTFRCNGNVVCLKGGVYSTQMVLLVIRESRTSSKTKPVYADEMSRAISLLSVVRPQQIHANVRPPSKKSVTETSVVIEDFLDSLRIST